MPTHNYTCKKCGTRLTVDHPEGFYVVEIGCKNPGHDVTIASGRTEQPLQPAYNHLWDLIRDNNLAAIAGAIHNQPVEDESQKAVDNLLDGLGIRKERDNG
jgi:hypothetical protein